MAWKIFFAAFAAFCLYGASPFGDSMSTEPTGPGTRVMLVALAAAFLLIAFRPRVTLTSGAVHLRGLLTTTVVPLDDLVRADVSYGGLRLERRSGEDAVATYIGEVGLLMRLLKRRTRGHGIASTINDFLADREPTAGGRTPS
jgi:hypothetical protein